MSACPVCYRDLEPVGGHCPSCGAARNDAPERSLGADDDEPTNYVRSRGGPNPAITPIRPRPVSTSAFDAEEQTPPRAKMPANAVAPRLILKGQPGDVTEYPLSDNNVLGRSTTANVRLADREVSRKHSQIDKQGEEYFLKDLGSSNGTFVASAVDPLPKTPIDVGVKHEVGPDDRIYLGSWTRLVIRKAAPGEVT